MILNLAIWFGLQVMFVDLAVLTLPSSGGLTLSMPVLSSFDPLATTIIAGALLAITKFGVGMIKVLAVSAAIGLALGSLGIV